MRNLCKLRPGLFAGLLLLGAGTGLAQIDPFHRNLLELGYDQPLVGHGPQGIYAYYYYNNPEICGTNTALRAALAPNSDSSNCSRPTPTSASESMAELSATVIMKCGRAII